MSFVNESYDDFKKGTADKLDFEFQIRLRKAALDNYLDDIAAECDNK